MADRNLELALKIRADMQQAQQALATLERELRETGNAANSASTGARAASEGVDAVSRSARQAETNAQALNTRMEKTRTIGERVNSTFHDLRNILLGAFVVHELVSFTSELVHANVEAQRIHYTLQQVFGEQGAAAQFKFVSQEAQRLGLDLQTAAEGYANLAASAQGTGLQTATLQRLFTGLSESATVLHSSAMQVNGVMIQLAQGMSLGRLQMQDIRAIAQNLPGTMTLVSEAAKRMGLNFQEAMQSGGLPAIQFLDTFADVLHERFGVQAVEASHSLNAELNRLKTTFFEVKTDGTGFADQFAGAIRTLNTSLTDPAVREGLQNLITGLGDVAAAAIKTASKVGDFIKAVQSLAQVAAFEDTNAIESDAGYQRALLKLSADVAEQNRRAGEGTVTKRLGRAKELTGSLLTMSNPYYTAAALATGRNPLGGLMDARDTARTALLSDTDLNAEIAKLTAAISAYTAKPVTSRNPQEGDTRGLFAGLPRGGTAASPVDPDQAKKIAEAAAKAQNELTQALIRTQAAMDPTAAAYARYNAQVKAAKDAAEAAKKATGANTEAIDAQRDAVIAGAQAELDAAKKKIEAQRLADQDKTVKGLMQNAPGSYRVPPEIGGATGELLQLQQHMKDLDTWHQRITLANQAFRAEDLRNEQQYQQNKADIEQFYRDRKAEADQAAQQLSLTAAQQGFDSLSSAMADLYGQQSSQYRAAFALQKAAALASTLIEGPKAIGKAFGESGSPIVGFAFAATIIAEFASLIAAIRGVSFSTGGYTGPGGKHQPAGVVHAGEVVWSQDDIARAGGVGIVETMRLRGYADGGVVQSPFANAPSPAALGFQSPPSPAVNTGRLMVAVSPVTVVVHSSGDSDVKSQQSTDNNGGQVLELFLGAVAKDINQGGTVAKAADRRWILQRKGNSYG